MAIGYQAFSNRLASKMGLSSVRPERTLLEQPYFFTVDSKGFAIDHS